MRRDKSRSFDIYVEGKYSLCVFGNNLKKDPLSAVKSGR
jgi:hypothetical protein